MAPTALAEPDAELGARLYEDHADELLRYCQRQLGSQTEAEDAVQTTFVCALRALRRGTVPENEAAWLTTIARNVCHWHRRTLARRGWQSGEVDLDTFASTSPEPGSYEDLRGLDEALASIPEQQRRAIVLREWLGVAPAEIAGKLGLTPTATHALLTRARVSLAGALTVARQPVVGLVWLVCELRSQLRNLLGAVTTKAGVAAVTVVASTGVGGLVVQQATGSQEAERATGSPAARADFGAGTVSPRGATSRVPSIAAPTVRASAPSSPAARRAKPIPARVARTRTRESTTSGSELPPATTGPPSSRPETAAAVPPAIPLPEALRVPVLPTPELPTVDSSVKLVRDKLTLPRVEPIVELVPETVKQPIPVPPPIPVPNVSDVVSTVGSGGVTPPPLPPPLGPVP